MGCKVFHMIHNGELFIVSKALSSQLEVAHVNHNPKLLITRTLSSYPELAHVIHKTEL